MKDYASFGMGCFWQPDLIFSKMLNVGIVKVEVGYMGGDEKRFPKPTYEQVCSGRSGYAEIVHVTFDDKKTGYGELLNIFWKNHNPTTINRQGPDIGSQYRSVIFYYNKEQEKKAKETKKKMQKSLGDGKIVTEIVKAGKFFSAEEYHQKYLEKHGMQSCHVNY